MLGVKILQFSLCLVQVCSSIQFWHKLNMCDKGVKFSINWKGIGEILDSKTCSYDMISSPWRINNLCVSFPLTCKLVSIHVPVNGIHTAKACSTNGTPKRYRQAIAQDFTPCHKAFALCWQRSCCKHTVCFASIPKACGKKHIWEVVVFM